jgi:ATP-binding cassette subfamily C protein LapB
LSTLLINILGFASPVFVMLILSVYINSGFHETLITLSMGMLIAMLMQLAFRGARSLWAGEISREPDRNLWNRLFEVLARARSMALERVPPQYKSELAGRVQTIQEAYGATNICAVLDAPFALLFVAAAFWLSNVLGFIALIGIAASLTLGLMNVKLSKSRGEEVRKLSASQKSTADIAFRGADTVRAFRADKLLAGTWREFEEKLAEARKGLAGIKGRQFSSIFTINILIRVLVYSFGAMEVVHGNLSLAGLIVGNIVVSRSMRQAGGLVGAAFKFSQAGAAFSELDEFFRLPVEPPTGTALREYKGGLAFKDLGFAWRGSAAPLFESLDVEIPPGSVVVAHGDNGTGKTTLARIVVGLLQPSRGDVAVDGINLRQIAQDWWSRQVFYVPQEPVFLATSIRDNIMAVNPDLSEKQLASIVENCGLDRFLAIMENGLDTQIDALGRNLATGFKKRLALARAMAVDGKLAVLDEPLEGLDAEGAQAVSAVISQMIRRGSTVVAFSHDVNIIRGANFIIDLNKKPVPGVTAAKAGTQQGAPRYERLKDGGKKKYH